MECLACGILIIRTNVGGAAELINEKTRGLVSVDITAEELAVTLKNELPNYKFDSGKRIKVVKFIKENYSTTKNYNSF